MNMANVSWIGWIHTLASVLSLLVGAYVLFAVKGTHLHRRMGKIYFAVMLVTIFTAFFIYNFDIQFVPFKVGPDIFGLFHYQTVFTVVLLFVALLSAPRQRHPFAAYAHPVAMTMTYYMLVAALINEIFVRVLPLRNFAAAQVAGTAVTAAQAPIVRFTQLGARIVFLLLIAWFVVKVARSRSARARVASAPTGDAAPVRALE